MAHNINPSSSVSVRQLSFGSKNHQLTNVNIWTPDSKWIAYDCRPTPSEFVSTCIEQIHIETQDTQLIYQSTNGANVGVVTVSPEYPLQYIFIHGPEFPSNKWFYDFHYRRGLIVKAEHIGLGDSHDHNVLVHSAFVDSIFVNFDGFLETPPLLSGVLHGGSHVHVFSDDGTKVSFTYNDYLLKHHNPEAEHRNVGIGFKSHEVSFEPAHPYQYVGNYFCILVSQTVAHATWGSDEIEKAYEECWIGKNGYINKYGVNQRWAIAFLGDTRDSNGNIITEIFTVDLPADEKLWKCAGSYSLTGDQTHLPATPKNVMQKRLTFTHARVIPGVVTKVRHWLRASPNGEFIACLMHDNEGIIQLWLVPTIGGEPKQVSCADSSMQSTFTWHPSGRMIAIACDDKICLCEINSGNLIALTPKLNPPPKAEAVVCSPNGKHIAFMRDITNHSGTHSHIYLVDIPDDL